MTYDEMLKILKCSGGTKEHPGHSYNFDNDGKCDTCEKKLLLIDGKPQGKSYTLKYSRLMQSNWLMSGNCDYRTFPERNKLCQYA